MNKRLGKDREKGVCIMAHLFAAHVIMNEYPNEPRFPHVKILK